MTVAQGCKRDVLEYNCWGCFHSPGTVSLLHHLLDWLPMNLQKLPPERATAQPLIQEEGI